MSEPALSLLQKLSHPDERVFEKGLVELAFLPVFIENAPQLFADICEAISDCDELGSIERPRRVGLILNVAPKDADFQVSLAAAAHAWQPSVKNAVAKYLPAEQKSRVYGRVRPNVRVPGPTPGSTLETPLTTFAEQTSDVGSRPEVLLLGARNEHQSNDRFLNEHNFRSLRAGSLLEFQNLLRNDVCGIVIGNSWWAIIAPQDHRSFVEELFGYSSFAWIKLDYSGCDCRGALSEIAKNLRFRDAANHELVFAQSSLVTDVDIPSLQRASRAIQNEASVRLCPADIQPSQAQVLIAGVCEHVSLRNPRTTVSLDEIATTTIDGGLSSALIVHAEPNDGGSPFIAKLASLPQLRDEMIRFDSFIRPWDDQLRPCFHYHNGTGAIIFGLVGTPDYRTIPAPTLDTTLHKALLVETGAPSADQPTEADLFTLIGRTVDMIRSLNERRCTDQAHKSMAWTDVSPLKRLVDRGISWHLSDASPPFDLIGLCDEARTLLNELGTAATVHGDIHLRNVLVRDGREPSLIDYAYAGPGHPCYDLVRLEAALLFQIFRMTDDEPAIADLLLSASEPNATLQSLTSQHPRLCTSLGNRVAIHASLLCRRACEALLTAYQAPVKHFAAMQFLIACQSLSNQRFQTGIVRAAVLATAKSLAGA